MRFKPLHRLTDPRCRTGITGRQGTGTDRFRVNVGRLAPAAAADDHPFGIELTGGFFVDHGNYDHPCAFLLQ